MISIMASHLFIKKQKILPIIRNIKSLIRIFFQIQYFFIIWISKRKNYNRQLTKKSLFKVFMKHHLKNFLIYILKNNKFKTLLINCII